MAKDKKLGAPKPPGRIKQMVQIYQNTKQYDRNLTLILALCFLVGFLLDKGGLDGLKEFFSKLFRNNKTV